MNETKKLTNEKKWDKDWQSVGLPQIVKTSPKPQHPYYIDVLDKFFHQHLPKNNNFELLELGCAPGRWLHYFNKEFGYKVSGLESSNVGFGLAKQNLDMLGIKSDIYFGDVLNYKFNKKFDIIFSMGLVEHFNPPIEIIRKHLELTKPNGYTIIGIPNFKSFFYRFLQYLINRQLLNQHILLSIKDLCIFLNESIKDSEVVYLGYIGVLNFYLLGISKKEAFLQRIICYCQIIFDKMLRIFSIKKETSLFSPYLFLILKKK